MLRNINLNCPKFQTSAQVREFSRAKAIMQEAEDAAGSMKACDGKEQDMDQCDLSVSLNAASVEGLNGSVTGFLGLDESKNSESLDIRRRTSDQWGNPITTNHKMDKSGDIHAYGKGKSYWGGDSHEVVYHDPKSNTISYQRFSGSGTVVFEDQASAAESTKSEVATLKEELAKVKAELAEAKKEKPWWKLF